MKLTVDEARLVRDRIARLELAARRWKHFRWVALFCLIAGLGSVILTEIMARNAKRDTDAAIANPILLHKPASLEDVRSSLKQQTDWLRIELGIQSKQIRSMLVAFCGVAVFVWVFSHPNRDREDLLFAKFLKEMISEDEKTTQPRDRG